MAGGRFGQCRDTLEDVELEEVSLAGGFHQPFSPWAEDIAAVKFDLPAQFFDELVVLLGGLVVELGRLIERGLEVLDLLGEPV